METLTEPGAVPVTRHPISPCGFYPKQDPVQYYFSGNSSLPQPPVDVTYSGFPQMSESDSWTNSQSMRNHVYPGHQRRIEDRQEERIDKTERYIPPTNARNSPYQFSFSIDTQPSQPPRFAKPSTSLPLYPDDHVSPSPRERDLRADSINLEAQHSSPNPNIKLNNTLISEKLQFRLHNPSEQSNYPTLRNNDNEHLYNYNKSTIHGGYTNDNNRGMYYHRDFHDNPHGLKGIYSNNSASVISYSQPSKHSVTSKDDHTVDTEHCQDKIVYTEFRERIISSTLHKTTTTSRVMTKESQIDQGREQSLSTVSDHPLFRKEMGFYINNSEDKSVDSYKGRDKSCPSTANSLYFGEEKRATSTTGDITPLLRGNQHGDESYEMHSAKNNMNSSPENSQTERQRYHLTSSPHGPCPSPEDNAQSPIKNDSTLHSFAPGKLPPFSPIGQLKYKDDNPSSPQRISSLQSPLLSHLKNAPKEDCNKDIQKSSHPFNKNNEMMECEEPLKPDGVFITQNFSATNDRSHSPLPQQNQKSELSQENPSKLCPPSPDVFAKTSFSEDESLDAKREIFSDDGDDDSACEDSMPHSPTFSPYHDSSIAYSQHFPPHPFFPSQNNGPFSSLRYQFGSLQGPPDRHIPGVGFPFRSMPGMPQDITMVGHMHPSRSPFVGSAPSGIGPVRQLTGDTDIFFCHLCSYSGKSKNEFDIHMNTHFEFNCPHCDYTSRTEGRLKRHIKDFHSEGSSRRSMPGRPKVYKCKQCQFSATEKDKFWAHSRTHIKEDKLLQCPKCPFVTEYKHHLEYHLRNHFGSKPFKCPKCNYSCVNKSMLNSHMKSHTNVYQYRCSECTYATKYCHSLKLHLKKYNHKPATVLNQDGSLPQGLDAGASGLSITSKRGPPRGPRPTIKDSNGPYMNHLFEMPQMPLGVGGMNPMLNGMMPFWPMLPQAGIPGHPSHRSGMLPEIKNLAQKMGIMADHRNISDCPKMDDTMEDISDNSSDGCKSSMRDKDEMCKFCNFIAESREALGLHLMQFHKEEAKEIIMSCGFSEAFLADSFRNANTDTKFQRQHLCKESPKESDGDQSSGEIQHRDSNIDIQYKEHSTFSRFKTDDKNESSKTPPPSRPQSLYTENYSRTDQHQGIHYNLVESNCKVENINCGSNSEIDILQQMTLKFGTEPLSDKKSSSANEGNKDQIKVSINVLNNGNNQRYHYIPLDLTKPKSVSPAITNVSPTKYGDDNDVSINENEGTKPYVDNHQIQCYSVDLESPVKASVTEIDDRPNSNNVSGAEMSLVAPRKRSRKGKAYKLDTLCLKLQKRQVDTVHDEDGESLESPFNNMQNIHTLEENMQDNIHHTNEPVENRIDSGLQASETQLKRSSYMSSSSDNYVDNEEDSSGLVKRYHRQNESNAQIKEDNIDTKGDDPSIISKSRQLVQEEAELELRKLQRRLSFMSPDLESAKGAISNNVEQNKNTEIKNGEDSYSYHTDGNSSEATIEDDTNLNNETKDSAMLPTQTSDKNMEDEDVDQVELINTVLENRKKTVPPEVRRGTELAWKLLNDPINPVTTLHLPVDTLNVPKPSNTSSVPSSGALILPDVNNPAAGRKDLKSHISLPHFSHPHQSIIANLHRTPLPHHLNIPQPHRSHTPQIHPHLQSFHNPHSTMSMKPLMSVPTPSTPMAYIPPTNRMMSEPPTASPCSRLKPPQKELYECTFCDLSFRDCVMYTVHMGYHSNQNPFQCNSCGVVSRDKVEFFLHIARSPHA